MHVAVVQHAGQVAEITDRPQTLQLLGHVALLPTAVASRHLKERLGIQSPYAGNTHLLNYMPTCVETNTRLLTP